MRIDIDDGEPIEVQMAPLIDCVFLLLIFFLVATTLRELDEELPVELPEALASVTVSRPDNILVISLDASGQIHLGAEPITLGRLHGEIKDAAAKNPDVHVRIDVDTRTPTGDFVHVYDLCRFEGLSDVNLKIADRPG